MGSAAEHGWTPAPCRGFHPRRPPALLAVAAAPASVATTTTTTVATTTTATVAPAIPLGPTFRLVHPDRPPIQFLPIQGRNEGLRIVGVHRHKAKPA